MAFADERHDVVALTIAAGNVTAAYRPQRLKLCDIVGRTDVPVFAGSPIRCCILP
jgi:purine nucleosidase